MTAAEQKSDIELTKDELLGVYYEDYGENWLVCNK